MFNWLRKIFGLPPKEEPIILGKEAKTKSLKTHTFLNQLHIHVILLGQTLAYGLIIAFTIWLFFRIPEPQVHVTKFEVDGVNETTSTNLRFSFTLHNPDVYKSIHYDVTFLRITYSSWWYSSYNGATIDYNVDGKGIRQGPRETTKLPDKVVDYTVKSMDWNADDMPDLKDSGSKHVIVQFVIQVRVLAFNKYVMGNRQRMRSAEIYFDQYGDAFIPHRTGLLLK